MSTLKDRIIRLIETNGPISVADYMGLCLGDSESGYYMTREPFGRSGDFITAPEVSQMFGELIGVWCLSAWEALGKPSRFVFAEIGPGRGTLMKDLLRAASRLMPDFSAGADIWMIETSPRLTGMQKATLADAPVPITWADSFDALPSGPLILVANELFDALPTHQYVKAWNRFAERMVGLDDRGQLCFAAGAGSVDPDLLPRGYDHAPEGAIFEAAPARSALMDSISHRLSAHRGAALLIDYGHLKSDFGDTLQALGHHKPQDVFEAPGEADLTSHVDFDVLEQISRASACLTATMTQGEFLLAMGLLERAGQLGRGKSEADQEQLHIDVERLAGPDQMGTLFKVLCVSDPATQPFPFFPG
ncbi:MAG: class I SAM-dependent methyltransferase [Phyllobacterium sp.]